MNTTKASKLTAAMKAVAQKIAKCGMHGFVCAVVAGMMVGRAEAADGTWDTNGNGNWTDPLNWVGNTDYASGADFTATLGDFIAANSTITLDAAITIGNITASDTTHDYTISGANILTLDRTDSTKPTINVTTSGRALTISSVIAGTDGLTKTGAGTLVLGAANNNTFTGGFDISAGRVQFSSTTHANAWGDAGNVITFTGNATLYNADGAYTLNRGIAVNNGVTGTIRGAFGETTTIAGAVTGSGTLTILGESNSFVSTLSNTANTFTGALSISANSTTTLNVTSLGSSANAITLGSGANNPVFTYTGSAALSRPFEIATTTGGVNINSTGSGALTASGFSVTGAGAKTITIGGASTALNTIAGNIANNGGNTSLTKADAGRWILGNAANSYTGPTTVSGGTLQVSTLANGSNNSNIGASTSVAGSLILNGGTLLYTGAAVTIDRLFSLQATSTINASGTGTLEFSNTGAMGFNAGTAAKTMTLTGTGSGSLAAGIANNTGLTSLAKAGIGTWVLKGANTATGTASISDGGTLVLDYTTQDNRKLPNGALTLAGGTIVLKGGTTTAEAASSTIFNTSNAGTFFVRDGGTAKINLNAFTIGTQSVISFSHDNMATTDRLNGTVTKTLGAWFTVGNRWAANAGTTDGNIVGYTGGTAFTPDSATSGDVNYDLAGGGNMTARRDTHTLRIESTGNDQVLQLNGNTLSVSNLTGTNGSTDGYAGGLLYAGGANGNYTITGTSAARLTPENGNGQALLINVYSGTLNIDVALSNSGSTLNKAGEGTLVMQKDSTGFTAATRVYQGALRLASAGASGTSAGGISVQNGAALELSGGLTFVADALSITGAGVSSGGALKNVSGANTYPGAITLGGATRVNSDSGTLTLTGGIVTGGNTVTVGGAGNTTVSTAAISGTGGLIKDGTGTLSLNVANTYSGATTISAGTLALGSGGSLNSASSVSIASGATFDVSGVGATYTFSSSATLLASGSGGTAATTIKGGSTSFTAAGPIMLTYDGSNPALIISQGALILSGSTQTITVNTAKPLPAGTYTIISVTGGSITGGGTYTLAGTAGTGTIGISGGNVQITITSGGSLTSTTTALTSTDSQTYGTASTIQATVTGAAASSGTVQFYADGAIFGSPVTIDGSLMATVPSTATLSAGTHKIMAAYSGDATHGPSAATSEAVLTVTVAPLTITATGPAKTYGQALVAGTSSANFTHSGEVNGEAVTRVTLTPNAAGLSATTAAGQVYTVTPSLPTGTGGFNPANYSITFNAFNGTVGKANATVTVTPYTVTYDGVAHSATVSTITGVNGQTGATVGTVDVSGTTHTVAGTYASDSWSFTGTANYNDIGATTITDTITPKALTMSGLSVPASKSYDGLTTAVVSGTPALDSAESPGAGNTSDGKPYTGDAVSITGTATGTYNSKDVASAMTVTYGGLSLTGAQAGNYTLTIQSSDSATITKATLTVTADNKQRDTGEANPMLTYTITDYQNNETFGGIGLTGEAPALSTTADSASLPGGYPITCAAGTWDAPNYTFSYVNGTLTVNPRGTLIQFLAE